MFRCQLVALSTAFVAAAAIADDAVKPKGSTITYRGEIVRYDERGLAMKWGPSKELKEFALDQIERVDTRWPDGFETGKTALDNRAFEQAAPLLRSALRQETRPWAQELIKGHLLRAVDGRGDVDGAAELFVELAPLRSDVAFLAFAPFRWLKDPPISEERRTTARAWLIHNDEPLVKLLAANWLIDTTDRAKAEEALEKLLTDPDERVRPIAKAILFREQLQKNPKAIAKEDVAALRLETELLPRPVRVGPQYVLGLAYEAAGEPIDAALAFLYIPFVIGGPVDLQIDALERAHRACLKANLKSDAAKIAVELQKRSPGSPAAKRTKSSAAPSN